MDDESKRATLVEGLSVRVLDVHGAWPSLCIGRTVPLGRIEWLWTLRGPTVRNDSSTSAKVIFDVTSSDEVSEVKEASLPRDWFQNAYLHILVVPFEELNGPRESQCNVRVRNFVDSCREYRLEYLVVLVADDNIVLTNRKSVEKLRAEVNVTARNRERLVIVPTSDSKEDQKPISHLHHSPAHQDLLVRLRECARDGVEARVQAYELEVSRCLANQSLPSWSLTTFFSIKEGMNFVFMQIGRRDLALRGYDEVETVMNETENIRALMFCDVETLSNASNLADPYARDFRRFVVDGSISELDVRVYLYSRQLSLLLSDRKYSEAAERGLRFITTAARRIFEMTNTSHSSSSLLSPIYRDVWVFKASRALASALAPAIPSAAISSGSSSKPLVTARDRHTARLVAGFHVHALKAFSGLASIAHPGTIMSSSDYDNCSSSSTSTAKAYLAPISDAPLKEALGSPSKAIELYSEIANAAASLYELGGRARGAAALDGDAGAMRLRNQHIAEAEELLSAQCSRFAEDCGWDQLHHRRRTELALAEKRLDRVQEYLVSCLTMLCMARTMRRVRCSSETQAETNFISEADAAYWASEVVGTAAKLPRVMKYKAEKLFTLSLRANDESWREGSPGYAYVQLESEVPAKLLVDSIHVEMRWGGPVITTAHETPPSSGLNTNPGDQDVHIGSEVSNVTEFLPSSNQIPGGMDPPAESALFTNNDSIVVDAGRTEIRVHCEEIPRPGRYHLNQISLIVGRLKLVQANLKLCNVPTVTTKGIASSKSSSSTTSASTTQADPLTMGKSRFPCFFASPKPPVAVVAVAQYTELFFLPMTIQYARITIRAGANGIASGSSLLVTLYEGSSEFMGTAAAVSACLNVKGRIEVVDANREPLVAGVGNSSLKLLELTVEENQNSVGTTVLQSDIQPLETLEFLVPIRVTNENGSMVWRDGVESSFYSSVHLEFQCREMRPAPSRIFKCNSTCALKFDFPLSVTAHMELGCNAGELSIVKDALGDIDDDADAENGGILYCSLTSCMPVNKHLTLRRVYLDLPPWLDHKERRGMEIDDILPYRMHSRTVFSIPFELRVRLDRVVSVTDADSSFNIQGHERTLQRVDNTLDIDPTEERFVASIGNNWTQGLTAENELSFADQTRTHPISRQGSKAFKNEMGFTSSNEDVKDVTALTPVPVTSTLDNIDVEEPSQSGGRGRCPEMTSQDNGVAARLSPVVSNGSDIVDLGSSLREVVDCSHDTVPTGGLIAFLKVEIGLDGVETASMLEYPISVEGLRMRRRRYCVERSDISTADIGQSCKFQFRVSAAGSSVTSREGFEMEVVYYEIDFDPSLWIVSGKTRGRILMNSGAVELLQVSILGLRTGRVYPPSLTLFDANGLRLAPSCVDVHSAGAQINILPSQRVSSSCSATKMSTASLDAIIAASTQPSCRPDESSVRDKVAVVAADSFFK